MRTIRTRLSVLVGALAVLTAGCGSPGKPVDPAPIGAIQGPQPAHVGGADEASSSQVEEGCDPTASLPPQGDVPPGSTMDKIKQRGRLVVGVDQTTFLFGFRDPTSGQLQGFDIDIAKEIAKALFGSVEGHIQFKAISSQQRESALQSGDVDAVVRTFTVNCSRLQKINFSSVYYEAGQRVLVPNTSTAAGLGDLGNQKVCAAKSSTSFDRIAQAESRPVPVSVDDWSDCLVMLQQGQVAAVSTDDTILAGMARQDPTTKIVGERFSSEPYGIGIPKQNEDMVRYVNAVLDTVRGGPWQQSYDTWIAPSLGPASPPAPVYK